jgi:hypothetical protein
MELKKVERCGPKKVFAVEFVAEASAGRVEETTVAIGGEIHEVGYTDQLADPGSGVASDSAWLCLRAGLAAVSAEGLRRSRCPSPSSFAIPARLCE